MAFLTKLFQPVRIHALFESRPYRLGETVDMAVQVVTRDRLEILRARAELLWTPKGRGAAEVRAQMGKGPFVHSSTTFSQRQMIRPGAEENFSVALRTELDPPGAGLIDTALSDASWKVRVTVETAMRKDYTLDNKIHVVPHWTAITSDLRDR